MQVPHADAAIVSQEKIAGYLLNPLHPDGAGKAWFFRRLGFRADQWEVFRQCLARASCALRSHQPRGFHAWCEVYCRWVD